MIKKVIKKVIKKSDRTTYVFTIKKKEAINADQKNSLAH